MTSRSSLSLGNVLTVCLELLAHMLPPDVLAIAPPDGHGSTEFRELFAIAQLQQLVNRGLWNFMQIEAYIPAVTVTGSGFVISGQAFLTPGTHLTCHWPLSPLLCARSAEHGRWALRGDRQDPHQERARRSACSAALGGSIVPRSGLIASV
ncbi:hypothetical protein [Bradyrhizobium sp. B120]|uniref:hypothetical protein n=1 Tax=Bradyrhizobium sp. B120 TaxID=3410088 RepID=UPI003B9819A3